ncbi:ABC transporter permease [Sporosarcina sp. FSL K6-3457]|uniref:ABC transporter permease n=1 Tax=Sporosarcina sp. FSL K6-3457 TaxID=2978204 RepID=UPI0030FB950C
MFLKILKKDLKRKKAMNAVLFVLIALASTLVASSTNLMYSTTTAVNSFISKSQVADFNIKIANTPENNKQIEEWANSLPAIDAYYSEVHIGVPSSNITVPDGSKSISTNSIISLSTLPQHVNLIFGQNDESFTVQDGEIGLPINIKNMTGIKIGDQLAIDLEGISKTFVVKGFFKDAFMGSDLIGLKRFIISQHDYDEIKQSVPEEKWIQFWSFVKKLDESQSDLSIEFLKSNILSDFDIDKKFVELMFMTDRIVSAILFIVSLFLIFISFLTLRFTIVSTIQDDYKEIGVMKAIGFTNVSIKRLYLMKYFGLSVVGGVIGLGISLPLTRMMSVRVSEYIIVPDSSISMIVSIFSTVIIVAITLLFCSLCMGKINQASVIDAIRQGHNGERFKASRKINLHKSKVLHITLFLAISDVLNQLKGYTTLIFTFVLSTVIILIPINLANTILAPKFISHLGTTQADFYLLTERAEAQMSEVRAKMDLLEQEFLDRDFDVTLSVDYFFNTKYILENDEGDQRIIGMNSETKAERYEYEYLDGVAPKLENEIAITGIMSERFNKNIGDSIVFEIDGKKQTFLISGTYQTIDNAGYAVRLSDNYKPVDVAGYLLMGNINAIADEKPQIIEDMKEQLKHLDIKSAMDIMGDMTGGFMGQLKMIIGLIIAIVSLITFFITSLFVRLLISKEVQGIAIMKSLGFTNGQIKLWQSLRILILLVASIILGVFASTVLGEQLVGVIFRMFGLTEFSMIIVPLQVYVWCPLLIITVVLLGVYTSCGQIKKIQVWDMNEE